MTRVRAKCRPTAGAASAISSTVSAARRRQAGEAVAATNTTPSALICTPGTTNIARSPPSRARRLASARWTRVRAVIGGAPTRAATSS